MAMQWKWNSQIIGLFVCIFFGDRFLIETMRPTERGFQSIGQFIPDHGSYSHIPCWLLIVTYNSEYVTITMKLCVENLPHIDPQKERNAFCQCFKINENQTSSLTISQENKPLYTACRFIESIASILFSGAACARRFIGAQSDSTPVHWHCHSSLMNISTGWPNV